jgi:Tol biopolymer transport system component
MGAVYRAHDAELARDVAMKVLPAYLTTDAGRVTRFEQEAKILAALNHANIAHVYGIERVEGTTALVMELVEGPTLAERIARGPIAVDEALSIAAQIADALEAAHERGIVHRDLKPANIKLKADDTVKVLDFGIAKALDSTGEIASVLTTPETQAGAVLGTAAYMSPEQARGRPVDQRADIWAFGCVLYEMLTGRAAFGGDDAAVILARVLEGHADLDALPPVSPSLRRTLELCFEKDPRKRLRHIGDVRLGLQGAFATRQTVARASPSSRVAWVGFAVAALAAVAVSAIHFGETAVKPRPTRLQLALPVGVSASTFSVSPDGRSLLLQAQAEGTSRLLVRSFDSVDFRELPGTEGAGSGFWSDDGQQVAFALRGALKKVAAVGGPVEEIVRDGVSAVGGCWANKQIIFQNSAGGLSRVPDSGGHVTAVTAPNPAELHHESAACLPNGRFLYFRHAKEAGASAIYVGWPDLAPDEQSSTPLVVADNGPLFVGHPAGDQLLFMKGDVLYAQQLRLDPIELVGEAIRVADNVASVTGTLTFAASAHGALVYREPVSNAVQLTWFDRDGRVAGTLLEPKSSLRGLKIAPDGLRAAIVQSSLGLRVNNDDVWLVPFDGGSTTRLTSDIAADLSPVWSPDSNRVAFASAREAQRAIYQQFADGGPAAELLSEPAELAMLPSDWSRDGRFIVGTSQTPQSGSDVRILTVSRDASETRPLLAPLIATSFRETSATYSPDGRWIAYVSDESGRTEVYVRAFVVPADGVPAAPESSQRLFSNGALGAPRWRADGRELLYVADDGKVMAVEVSTVDGNLQPRPPRALFQLPPAYVRNPGAALGGTVLMDILPDASRILVPVPVEDDPVRDLEVILNWH